MRWVNDTLPPRARARWLLMTVRLSMSSLAGTARTEVAVGTSRLASMLSTTRAAGPLSGWSTLASASSRGTAAAGADGWAGVRAVACEGGSAFGAGTAGLAVAV